MKEVKKKTNSEKEKVISFLKELPVIGIVCKKSGISRATYYRWRSEDLKFLEDTDKAVEEGIENINDMSESKLMSLIKESNFPAISLWLRKNHKRFSDNQFFEDKDNNKDLTSYQKESVKKCLKFLS